MSAERADDLSDSWVCVDKGEDRMSESHDLPPMLFSQTESHSSHRYSKAPSMTSSKSICSCSPPLSMASGSSGGEIRPRIDIPHQQIADFIWDWSSRPEVVPPTGYEKRLKLMKIEQLPEERDSQHDDEVYTLANLPKLILTHACTFIVGAALMFLVVKRISNRKWFFLSIAV